MILRKSIVRTVKEKKFQYIGVIVLLLLAVMLYVSMSMAISTLEKRNTIFKNENKQETFHFLMGSELSEVDLETIEKKFMVHLEKRMYKDLALQDQTTLRLAEVTTDVNIPYIGKGSLPDERGEIAVAEVFADAKNLKIGEEIKMNGDSLTITGFVFLPDYIYMIESQNDILSNPEQFGVGITTAGTLSSLDGPVKTEILGRTPEGDVPDGLRAFLNERGNLLKFVSNEDNARIQFVETEIESAEKMITTLPLFILALSIAMVLLLLKRRLELQRKEIGTLMALGYHKRELLFHYLGFAWFVGLTGTVLGLLAGGGLSIPLSNLYANYFNLPSISIVDWDPVVLIIGFLTPLVLLISLTAYVIHKTLKTEPLSLLKPKEMPNGKKSWLENLPGFREGGFIKRFRLRLLVRSKAKSVYIFVGVMFSTVLLLFGLITFHSMDRLVDTTYRDIMQYDYEVHYSVLKTERPEKGATPFTMNAGTAMKGGIEADLSLYGVVPGNRQVTFISDEEVLNDPLQKGAVISRPLAAILNVSPGGTFLLENPINNKEMEVHVAGVTDIFIGNHVYLPKKEVNAFLGLPEDTYTSVWMDEKPHQKDDLFMVIDKQQMIDSFESTSGATRNSVIGMAVFAVMIGVIVLTLLTNLIVEEHAPSISLFKVLGYHDNEISKLVLNVYTPLVFLSYFVSVPIAGYSLELTMNSLVKETGFLFPTDIQWWMVIAGFLLIAFTYWFSLTLSKRKLKNVSLQEALKKQQD